MMSEDDRQLLLRLNGAVEGMSARLTGTVEGIALRLTAIENSMLVTVDEIKRLRERMHDLASPVSAIAARIATMEASSAAHELHDASVHATLVSRDAFEPVKRVAYGLVALITSAVVLAILGLVLRGKA